MQSASIAGVLCFAAVLCAAQASAQSNVYRWVDKDGKVHFSDTPPAPAEARESAQKRMGGGYVEEQFPYAVREAMKSHPVTVYMSSDCGEPCAQGRELVSNR